jgi:hypothetical protein
MNPQDDILDALIQDGQYSDGVDYGDYLPQQPYRLPVTDAEKIKDSEKELVIGQ